MNNLIKTIEVLFKKKNPEEIIQLYLNNFGNKKYKYLSNEEFLAFFRTENRNLYNKNEITNIYKLYEDTWKEKSIFSTLLKFTENVLVEENGFPCCKYDSLLKWRELSFQVGEDLLTTSFLAYNDIISEKNRENFSWPPIIGNNNQRLNMILKKGVAENHFHLKGSGFHFNISWVCLMNNPEKREKEFGKLLKEKKLNPRIEIEFSTNPYDLELLVKKATLIRFFLYGILNNKRIIKEECLRELLTVKSIKEYNVKSSIKNIDIKINTEKLLVGKRIAEEVPDYWISQDINKVNFLKKSTNILLCGERIFLYKLFKKIYSGDIDILKYEHLFYAYILIKQQFRDEIIQVNRSVGFGNFGDYQDRKSLFITKKSIYEKAIINSAINSSFLNQSISSLEARIRPESSMKKLNKEIEKLDFIIMNDIFSLDKVTLLENKENKDKNKEKIFYTLHFIKSEEPNVKEKNIFDLGLNCRNKEVRETILREVRVISEIRKSNLTSRFRFFGIDAANVEIGCRPEVFATAYRYLKHIENNKECLLENISLHKLGRTFHVGEEFLDIADGLRAIDECVKFLNFSHGDRIGHALALGIDPLPYYMSKDMILVLSKQDLLDNIAWILGKTIEKGIEYSSTLRYRLENLFKKYFHEIYEKNCKNLNHCCYRTYYESWKLRGDDPSLYKRNCSEFELIKFNLVKSNKNEEASFARNNEYARNIYREYHYNENIKIVGAEIAELKIDYEYINLIKKIQKSMQIEISEKNISIETNPSSNYLIGTFKEYKEHPIKNFYNLGLVSDPDLIKNCPQISVSINTDDQGVFATCLENEYALIALSLEKEINEFGHKVYNPSMIYDWIDRIRQMGIEQSFNNQF